MSDNKQSQQREENANINLMEKILKPIDVYGGPLEGKWHQSLTKPDKINFFNELKRTELAKQKHGVNTIHGNICVTFDMSFATPLYIKKNSHRTQHVMPFCNNSVNQNRFEGQN